MFLCTGDMKCTYMISGIFRAPALLCFFHFNLFVTTTLTLNKFCSVRSSKSFWSFFRIYKRNDDKLYKMIQVNYRTAVRSTQKASLAKNESTDLFFVFYLRYAPLVLYMSASHGFKQNQALCVPPNSTFYSTVCLLPTYLPRSYFMLPNKSRMFFQVKEKESHRMSPVYAVCLWNRKPI
jgi:hypothetical protein